jgi:hypothetical protein
MLYIFMSEPYIEYVYIMEEIEYALTFISHIAFDLKGHLNV